MFLSLARKGSEVSKTVTAVVGDLIWEINDLFNLKMNSL